MINSNGESLREEAHYDDMYLQKSKGGAPHALRYHQRFTKNDETVRKVIEWFKAAMLELRGCYTG